MVKCVSYTVIGAAAGWIGGLLVVAFLTGCTSAQLQTRLSTIERLAQCVEPVVLDEIAAREKAAAAAVEQSHEQTPREAVDAVARDAGAM